MNRAPGRRTGVLSYSALMTLSFGLTAIAGCGSSDAESAASTIASETASTSDDVGSTDRTGAGDSTSSSAAAEPSNDMASFCEAARTFEEADPTGDVFSVDDPAVIEQQWDEFDALLGGLVDTAPAEIAPDFEKVASTFGLLRKAYEQAGWDAVAVFDVVEADPELRAVFEGTDPEADAAGERISVYLDEACGPTTT